MACQQIFHSTLWLAAALAVSTVIAVMHATRTLHPPGGATALIMLVIALLVNNIPKQRR